MVFPFHIIMRRQGNISRSNGYQNTSRNAGTHHINQGIDNVPSRIQAPRSPTYPPSYPSVVPTASEAIWNTESEFSRQIATDSPFHPLDLSDSDDVDDDDDDGLYSPQTTLEWDYQERNRPPSHSSLSDDSYALSDDATQALEDVWAEFTASQSQSTDIGSSPHLQRQQTPSPISPSDSSLSLEPVLSLSPVRINHQDERADTSQQQRVDSVMTTTTSVLSNLLDLVWRRSRVECPHDGAW